MRTNKLFLQFAFIIVGLLSLSIVLLSQMNVTYASPGSVYSAFSKLKTTQVIVRLYKKNNSGPSAVNYFNKIKKNNFIPHFNTSTIIVSRSVSLRIRKEYLARLSFSYAATSLTPRVSRLNNQEKSPLSADMNRYLTKKVAGIAIFNLKAVLNSSYVQAQPSKEINNFFQKLAQRK